MTTEIVYNSDYIVHLEPESEVEKLVLKEMVEAASKGVKVDFLEQGKGIDVRIANK